MKPVKEITIKGNPVDAPLNLQGMDYEDRSILLRLLDSTISLALAPGASVVLEITDNLLAWNYQKRKGCLYSNKWRRR